MDKKSRPRFAIPSASQFDSDEEGGPSEKSAKTSFQPGQLFAQAKKDGFSGQRSKNSNEKDSNGPESSSSSGQRSKNSNEKFEGSNAPKSSSSHSSSSSATSSNSSASTFSTRNASNFGSAKTSFSFTTTAPTSSPAASTSAGPASVAKTASSSVSTSSSVSASTSSSLPSTSSSKTLTTAPSTTTFGPPSFSGAAKKNAIVVNPKQRGNPILKFVTNVPWEYGDIVPDYQVGLTACVLFLSLRYHNLNPEYIHKRLDALKNMYELRVLLVQVDVNDPHHSLKELALLCILANCTLMVAWTPEEAGKYLETYKSYESKPPDAIMARTEEDFQGQLADALTTVKGINKTDATTLLSTFDSLAKIVECDEDRLLICPGLGPLKAKRLCHLFQTPFKNWK